MVHNITFQNHPSKYLLSPIDLTRQCPHNNKQDLINLQKEKKEMEYSDAPNKQIFST